VYRSFHFRIAAAAAAPTHPFNSPFDALLPRALQSHTIKLLLSALPLHSRYC
jgi:hypothetical protein